MFSSMSSKAAISPENEGRECVVTRDFGDYLANFRYHRKKVALLCLEKVNELEKTGQFTLLNFIVNP